MIVISSDFGRIGPFWWINGRTCAFMLLNATYNGSEHLVWREGCSGWFFPRACELKWSFKWRIIR
jgi:hypothetical protein